MPTSADLLPKDNVEVDTSCSLLYVACSFPLSVSGQRAYTYGCVAEAVLSAVLFSYAPMHAFLFHHIWWHVRLCSHVLCRLLHKKKCPCAVGTMALHVAVVAVVSAVPSPSVNVV